MSTLKTAAATLLTLTFTACANEKRPAIEQPVLQESSPKTEILSVRSYSMQDTIAIQGKLYSYTFALEPADTLPCFINPQGQQYRESKVKIRIMRDSTKIFDKTFYKNNFRNIVPADFLMTSTMVGVNYNYNKRDEDRSAFYFIVTAGDPDETSDMVYPLELKIAPDGSYSIHKAEGLETAPLSTGLNIDPSEDAI